MSRIDNLFEQMESLRDELAELRSDINQGPDSPPIDDWHVENVILIIRTYAKGCGLDYGDLLEAVLDAERL